MAVLTMRRSACRVIACCLMLALLMGALPISSGVTIQGRQPTFTLDICHPLQAAVQSSSPSSAPLVPSHALAQPPTECGAERDSFLPWLSRVGEAPDPPPPRST